MLNRSILQSFGVACLCLSLTPAGAVAQPVGNVLETPAMASPLAAQALLTDAARAGDRLVAVGERGHIVYSDNTGQSWTQAEVPVSTLINAVHFGDEQNGWAVGHGAVILHSSDKGATWQKQFDGYQASKSTIALLEQEIAALEDEIEEAPEEEQEDLEFELEDLMFTLDDARYDADSGPWKPLLDVLFLNGREGFAVGSYGFFFHTEDAGKTWTNLGMALDNPNRSHLNAITRVTGGALFIAGEYGLLFRSTDDGATWEALEAPYQGSFFGITGTGNVNEVLAFGLRGNVFRSTDLGRSWTAVELADRQTLMGAGQGRDNKLVLVGNNGLVAVSSNAGQSFRTYIRPDRESLLDVVVRDDGSLLLVGETGAVIAGPDGLNAQKIGSSAR
ncbi:MAG: photosystem I reaction center subunit IV [Alteromonadaceae bacterium]|nr:photosystem I reaction center subunit IV [Alteromonadaceae bacterium]